MYCLKIKNNNGNKTYIYTLSKTSKHSFNPLTLDYCKNSGLQTSKENNARRSY